MDSVSIVSIICGPLLPRSSDILYPWTLATGRYKSYLCIVESFTEYTASLTSKCEQPAWTRKFLQVSTTRAQKKSPKTHVPMPWSSCFLIQMYPRTLTRRSSYLYLFTSTRFTTYFWKFHEILMPTADARRTDPHIPNFCNWDFQFIWSSTMWIHYKTFNYPCKSTGYRDGGATKPYYQLKYLHESGLII